MVASCAHVARLVDPSTSSRSAGSILCLVGRTRGVRRSPSATSTWSGPRGRTGRRRSASANRRAGWGGRRRATRSRPAANGAQTWFRHDDRTVGIVDRHLAGWTRTVCQSAVLRAPGAARLRPAELASRRSSATVARFVVRVCKARGASLPTSPRRSARTGGRLPRGRSHRPGLHRARRPTPSSTRQFRRSSHARRRQPGCRRRVRPERSSAHIGPPRCTASSTNGRTAHLRRKAATGLEGDPWRFIQQFVGGADSVVGDLADASIESLVRLGEAKIDARLVDARGERDLDA